MPPNTGPSSIEPTATTGPGTKPATSAPHNVITEATTFRVDVEALGASADGLAALRLPAPVMTSSPGSTGDEVLDAVLREFCRRYNELIDDTTLDHGAAIGHLRGTANDYAAAETTITHRLLTLSLAPTTPPDRTPPDRTPPEAAQPARA